MATPREDSRAAEFIDSLQREKMKTHCKRDGSERVIILYEAPVHVQSQERCLATVYEYTGANTVPVNTREKEALWGATWDDGIDAILVSGDVGYTEP